MTREASDSLQSEYTENYPELNPLFTFAVPGYNLRNQEMNAVLGLSQLGRMGERLEYNVKRRKENFKQWVNNLRYDSDKFYTDFDDNGNSNFALPLILKEKDLELFEKCCILLNNEKVEYRIGTAGGGNQARQPYLEKYKFSMYDLSNVDHIHDFGLYIGNHPELSFYEIDRLARRLCEL